MLGSVQQGDATAAGAEAAMGAQQATTRRVHVRLRTGVATLGLRAQGHMGATAGMGVAAATASRAWQRECVRQVC